MRISDVHQHDVDIAWGKVVRVTQSLAWHWARPWREYVGIAWEGFRKALYTYNPAIGDSPGAWAYYKARFTVLDALRSTDPHGAPAPFYSCRTAEGRIERMTTASNDVHTRAMDRVNRAVAASGERSVQIADAIALMQCTEKLLPCARLKSVLHDRISTEKSWAEIGATARCGGKSATQGIFDAKIIPAIRDTAIHKFGIAGVYVRGPGRDFLNGRLILCRKRCSDKGCPQQLPVLLGAWD